MEEVKEIKSVNIVPFTLMSSAVSAVLGLIYALVLIIILGVVGLVLPSQASILTGILLTAAVALILVLPVSFFLFSVLSSFLLAFIYNLLVPKVGGIKIGLVDMKEVHSLPVLPLTLMVSILYTILTLILMLVVAPILMLSLQGAAIAAAGVGTSVPEIGGLGALGIIGIIVMVIGIPIAVFVFTFIYSALMAIFYNILAPKIGGVRFKFKSIQDNMFEIKKIKPVPLALISAVVLTILNFLFAIPQMIMYFAIGNLIGGIGYLLGNIIGSFVAIFIIYILMAVIYNYLRSIIGGVELELE